MRRTTKVVKKNAWVLSKPHQKAIYIAGWFYATCLLIGIIYVLSQIYS